MQAIDKKGKIITFYSYKGGVGRSMALVNAAWILGEKFKKVLIVDWDLEAPGLHKFFDYNKLAFKDHKGLVDYLVDHKSQYTTPDIDKELKAYEEQLAEEENLSSDEFAQKILDKEVELVNKSSVGPSDVIQDMKFPVIAEFDANQQQSKQDEQYGSISILTAGREDRNYSKKVNELDWNVFYSNQNGQEFIENFKTRVKKEFDYILVDSRTGVTDTGGICTLQLPEVVVMAFVLNEQNISGTNRIMRSIRENSRNEKPPTLYVLPTRVEGTETDLSDLWRDRAFYELKNYLPYESIEDWHDFFSENAIPHQGYFNFGEKIAAKERPRDQIAKNHRALVERITNEELGFQPTPEKSSQRAKSTIAHTLRGIRGTKVIEFILLITAGILVSLFVQEESNYYALGAIAAALLALLINSNRLFQREEEHARRESKGEKSVGKELKVHLNAYKSIELVTIVVLSVYLFMGIEGMENRRIASNEEHELVQDSLNQLKFEYDSSINAIKSSLALILQDVDSADDVDMKELQKASINLVDKQRRQLEEKSDSLDAITQSLKNANLATSRQRRLAQQYANQRNAARNDLAAANRNNEKLSADLSKTERELVNANAQIDNLNITRFALQDSISLLNSSLRTLNTASDQRLQSLLAERERNSRLTLENDSLNATMTRREEQISQFRSRTISIINKANSAGSRPDSLLINDIINEIRRLDR